MFEAFDKLILAGLGALSMSREKAEEIFDDYVEKGKAAREHREGFVKEVMDMADRTRTDLEKTINEQVSRVLEQQPIITKADLKKVEEKLAAIEAKLDQILSQ